MAQKDYKHTLNLPDAEFSIPMKANLAEQEPQWQAFWEQMGFYALLQAKPAPNGLFILHDGPPYSNAHIHMGHAMNKVLKDIIVRHRSMIGYRTPYIHGWDNHGMPIENAVASQFIEEGRAVDKVTLRRACREHAMRFVCVQRDQMKRLGVIGDWNRSYLTMAYAFEAGVVRIFGEMAEKGFIYRDLRSVLWCPVCQTALAEAELEYEEHESNSIYVRFPLLNDPKGVVSGYVNPYVIIWTTTPWTIPANLAVAVHPLYTYVFVKAGEVTYLLVEALVEATMNVVGVSDYEIVGRVAGKELEGIEFKHPIFDRASPVVLADYVLLEEGTGVVHTAPGHGREDFETGRQYGLPILCPVDERGRFTSEAGEFAGLPIDPEGNARVIERLREVGNLLAHGKYRHNYPHCWRCDSPLLFRATVQWFMNIDHHDHRTRSVEAIKEVRWIPPETENRITAAVEGRPDWCLSRQRAWGVGIPAFFCEDCGESLVTRESVEAVAQAMEAEGSDVWFDKPAHEILPSTIRCQCGSQTFRKETDVLDVWFDSGSTHRLVLESRTTWAELQWPADLYFEGSDQHRGWFNSSLMIAMATKGAPPYRAVITHGFVLDGEGRKMSKREGNVMDPMDICNQYGADVLRLWTASTEYFQDVRLSDEILKHVVDAYRQIRNTLRFMLGNLYDYDSTMTVPYTQLPEIDRWMLARLQELVRYSTRAYESYEYHLFYHAVRQFCTVDLSAVYLDVLKDRLYVSVPNDPARRAAQTVLLELTSTLSRLLAPVLVHTCEETWQRLPLRGKSVSVHLSDFPQIREEWVDKFLLDKWHEMLRVREQVNRAVEAAKQQKTISNPQSALVRVRADQSHYNLLSPHVHELARLWVVSQAELSLGAVEGLEIEVLAAPGEKCARCWLVLPDAGTVQEYPDLCARCAAVMQQQS